MDYKEGLQPVIGSNPRILILGSLPGDESLRKQEYYGNPRNMFWDVMSGVLGEKAPIRYPERVEYLKRHGIALWDALHAAEREGSLDANIKNEEFNDIAGLLVANPSIEVIAQTEERPRSPSENTSAGILPSPERGYVTVQAQVR